MTTQLTLMHSAILSGELAHHAPAQRHSETSVAAANAIEPNAETLRRKVLMFLRDCGWEGATDEEIQTGLDMQGSTQRPRRIELVNAGLVRKANTQRRTTSNRLATVWVAI